VTARRPSKPWRVILTGPDVHAESAFTSEDKAFTFVRAVLGEESPADTAKVMQWADGRWWHFETMHKEDMP
jgi:hypothetical protein